MMETSALLTLGAVVKQLKRIADTLEAAPARGEGNVRVDAQRRLEEAYAEQTRLSGVAGALQQKLAVARFTLQSILDQPSPLRNPDGEDDYVPAVRLACRDALDETGG